MNNFLLYLGGVLIAALALLFAAPHFIDWNSYRGVFEAEATRILGRDVRVGGTVNVRFLPAPYVSFEKVRIADQGAESGSIIRIDSFTMWLSVAPLLRGVLEAHQVELRRPVLQLSTDATGGGNWRSLSLNPGAMPFVPKDVALQSVRVSDGAIIVNGPAQNELARLADITGELAAEALDGPYKFKGSLKWDGELRQARFATAKQDPNGDIRFKAAVDTPKSGNSYILDGRVSDLRGTPKLDGELTAKLAMDGSATPATAAKEIAMPEPPSAAPASPAQAPPAAKTEVATAPSSPGTAAPTPAAAKPVKPGFDIRAKVSGDTVGFELSDLSATLDTGTGVPQLIAGTAKLTWADKVRLDVKLDSRWLDLDRLAKPGQSDVPLEAARGLFETVAAALPDEADTTATLDFDQLTLGGEPISNVHFAATRSGGPLEIKGVRATLPGGTRLQLEGVLTPGTGIPRIDGSIFISGQSLLRFIAWGFRKPDIGDSRTDGPFALDGRFALAENYIELTNATAEISETPVSGAIKLSLGERKQLAVNLEGARVDATQIRSGVLGLNTIKELVLGTGGEKDAASSADLSLKLRLAELADGNRVLRDVDAEVAVDRGALSIPRLKFSTPEGLVVDAEGSAKDIATQPEGAIRALIAAPNEEAAKAFIRLLDLEDGNRQAVERFARLTPARVATTLTLHRGNNASHLAVDGSLGGGRVTAALELQGGPDGWRKSPSDLTLTITSPTVEKLASALFNQPQNGSATVPTQQPGQFLLKAAGTPATGLLTLAELTSDTFSLEYEGRILLPSADQTSAAGTVKIASADARNAFALAGINLGNGASGIPLTTTLALARDGATTKLSTDTMKLGVSTVSGTLTIGEGDNGARTVTASLTADKASFTGLLAPVLSAESSGPITPPQPQAARDPRRDGKALAQAPLSGEPALQEIWPEQAFNLSSLDQLSGTVSARIGALSVEPGLTITDATIEAAFGPRGITVGKLDGSAVGGKLRSKLDFERARAGVGLTGSLRIDIASKPQTAGDAAANTPGDVAAFAVDFTGRALSPAALVTSLTGKGTITAGDATLTGMSPAAVAGVVEAAVSGKGPASGDALVQAIKAAAKEGEVKLGKIEIPVTVGDGALKLDKVSIEAPEGRSSFSSVVDLASMKLDSEWQIEPRLSRPSAANQPQPYLPAVSVVYTGKLSALSALEPIVSTGALERELSVRKMERDVDQLEALRKQDQARARQEKERLERERRKALEATPPQPTPQQQPAWGGAGTTTIPAPEAGVAPGGGTVAPNPAANAGDAGVNASNGAATASAAPDATAPQAAPPRPQRKRKPADDQWRPFESSPF